MRKNGVKGNKRVNNSCKNFKNRTWQIDIKNHVLNLIKK